METPFDIEPTKYNNPPLTKDEREVFIKLSWTKNRTEQEEKEYLKLQEKDFKNFSEIMSGMDEVNNKMAEDIDKALREEQPTCHFTKMGFDDGIWYCKHCSHEVESLVYPSNDYDTY